VGGLTRDALSAVVVSAIAVVGVVGTGAAVASVRIGRSIVGMGLSALARR
jgi:hypothetical protein